MLKEEPEENKVGELLEQKEGGEQEETKVTDEDYPSHGWFLRWRESLLLPNIKVAIQHTYSKAMAYRNQMIEVD